MATVGHIVYKADDLAMTVDDFRDRGFEVQYGQTRNPKNALIYFTEGPYLEIRTDATIPAVIRSYLRLIGHGKMVDSSMAVAAMPEGYSRIVLEIEREEFGLVKRTCRELGIRTLEVPISRKDPSGRKLKCTCLSPDDWALPLFVTPFEIDTHRAEPHPNGVTRMEHIVFEGSDPAVEICRRVGVDDRLIYHHGDGAIGLEFA